MKRALIYGVTGQDGRFLSELLLEKEYNVYGVARRASTNNRSRIQHLLGKEKFVLLEGDVTDPFSVTESLNLTKPDEIYFLSAQSHVKTSFSQPSYTFDVNVKGLLNVLEWVRINKGKCKIYNAASSEMYGAARSWEMTEPELFDDGYHDPNRIGRFFQDEQTTFSPCSPYAVAKLAAFNLARVYRDSYNLFVSSGILFNHESEYRGEEFVTRKITLWIGQFNRWLKQYNTKPENLIFIDDKIYIQDRKIHNPELSFPKLRLGNLDAKRDFGYAGDYVEAMYLMLQQGKPDDFVVATGETYSVRQFLQKAFCSGRISEPFHNKLYVVDKNLYRPLEVDYLCGDSSKARKALGWSPKVSFNQLVELMVTSDL